MKARITHLKAPWPAGARVGDVVEFKGEHAPGWAIGKFERADNSAQVTAEFAGTVEVTEHPEVARLRQEAEQALAAAAATREQLLTDHAAEIRSLKSEHAVELADMQARLESAIAGDAAKHQVLLDANAALTKQLAEAQAALAAAATAANKAPHTGKR
jgi:hypothetical protein